MPQYRASRRLHLNLSIQDIIHFNYINKHTFKKILTKPNIVEAFTISSAKPKNPAITSIEDTVVLAHILSKLALLVPLFKNLKQLRIYFDIYFKVLVKQSDAAFKFQKCLERLPFLTLKKIFCNSGGLVQNFLHFNDSLVELENLKNNFQTFIPNHICLMFKKREEIELLHANQLLKMPEIFHNMTRLTLKFSKNAYLIEEFAGLFERISILPQLKAFSLLLNNISKWDKRTLEISFDGLFDSKIEEFEFLLDDEECLSKSNRNFSMPSNFVHMLSSMKNLQVLILRFRNIKIGAEALTMTNTDYNIESKLNLKTIDLESVDMLGISYQLEIMLRILRASSLESLCAKYAALNNEAHSIGVFRMLSRFINLKLIVLNFHYNGNKFDMLARDLLGSLDTLKCIQSVVINSRVNELTCETYLKFIKVFNSAPRLSCLHFNMHMEAFCVSEENDNVKKLIRCISNKMGLRRLYLSVDVKFEKRNLINLIKHIRKCYFDLEKLELKIEFKTQDNLAWLTQVKEEFQHDELVTII